MWEKFYFYIELVGLGVTLLVHIFIDTKLLEIFFSTGVNFISIIIFVATTIFFHTILHHKRYGLDATIYSNLAT